MATARMVTKRERYISAREIQERLGVGKTKSHEILHSFAARGRLFKYGRILRVKESDFDEWLRQNGG